MKGKKFLTILLCVMLLGSSVPTGVLAAEDVPVETAAAEATAASMALPPFLSTSSPEAAACGQEQFTMPPLAYIGYLIE